MKTKLPKCEVINETEERLPDFHSFAEAMGNAGRRIQRPTGKKLLRLEDIKLKIEWLKSRRMKFICKNKVKHTDTPVIFWSDVEEAFEDVIK